MDRKQFFEQLAANGVRGLSPYVPGKPLDELEREYGIRDSIKLASNENPLGPPPAALDAIRADLADLALYPDGSGYRLKQALAVRLRVDPATITRLASSYLQPEAALLAAVVPDRAASKLDTVLEHELPEEMGARAMVVYRAPGGDGI